MSCVFVISQSGECLMPTKRFGHIRHLLKDGKATIVKHRPFTVQLTYSSGSFTQPMEIGVDTGYEHIGISVKSEAEEYVSADYENLKDEKSKHDDCRKYRRTRRNHLRYRAPRWNNRTRKKDWLAPSLQHKMDNHINLIKMYCSVAPITDITIEVGKFDPALIKAIESGEPAPEGVDYQHGPLYYADTLRAAVFERDDYTCQICKKSAIKDGVILHTHHALYWKGRHADTLNELLTVCSECHTSSNHQEGGKLWGLTPKVAQLEGSTFMNAVRWQIYYKLKNDLPGINIHITYGTVTARKRKDNGIERSHANDAYCIGLYMPAKRADTEYYRKRRRNNRILEKFYDAKYIDIRTGEKASGKELSCNRTNRREPRQSEKSLRMYRGEKVTKGRRSVRKQRYSLRPGDKIKYSGEYYTVKGIHCKGSQVLLDNGKSVAVKKVLCISHVGGWVKVS